MFKWIPVKYRDTVERIVWTVLAAGLAAIPVELADWDAWWVAGAIALANWLLIELRKLTPLPSPGEGLPGAPT
jgi:hypothetical protein